MKLEEFRKHSIPLCLANKSFNKVFGIGANKTGTTSLQLIFSILGLDVAPQHLGEITGFQACKGNIHPLQAYINKHDAFQDAPFSIGLFFAQVDALYPNSKFILTVRESEKWFRSLVDFHKKIMGISKEVSIPARADVENYTYLFKGYFSFLMDYEWVRNVDANLQVVDDWSLLYNKDYFIRKYEARNQLIIKYFSERKDDLLVVDLTKEQDTKKIVSFLGLPSELVTRIPHANKT